MTKTIINTVSYCGGLIRHFCFIIRNTGGIKSATVISEVSFIIRHCWKFTLLIGSIVGAIVTLQFTLHARQFDILSYLGGLCASGIMREMGPLMIAFMMVGKIGAYTTAELSAMSVTQQIMALEALGVDTDKLIVVPRFIGIIMSAWIVLSIGMFSAVTGSLFIGIGYAGLTYEQYLRSVPLFLSLSSFIMCLVKCLFFSIAIAVICTYESSRSGDSAADAGRSVVKSSVITMIALVLMDVLISFTFHLFDKIIR